MYFCTTKAISHTFRRCSTRSQTSNRHRRDPAYSEVTCTIYTQIQRSTLNFSHHCRHSLFFLVQIKQIDSMTMFPLINKGILCLIPSLNLIGPSTRVKHSREWMYDSETSIGDLDTDDSICEYSPTQTALPSPSPPLNQPLLHIPRPPLSPSPDCLIATRMYCLPSHLLPPSRPQPSPQTCVQCQEWVSSSFQARGRRVKTGCQHPPPGVLTR